MQKWRTGFLLVMAVTILTACVIAAPADPYVFSTTPCDGCWYGTWGGRAGWHKGGGRPWEREHHEGDHQGEGHMGEGPVHQGHF